MERFLRAKAGHISSTDGRPRVHPATPSGCPTVFGTTAICVVCRRSVYVFLPISKEFLMEVPQWLVDGGQQVLDLIENLIDLITMGSEA